MRAVELQLSGVGIEENVPQFFPSAMAIVPESASPCTPSPIELKFARIIVKIEKPCTLNPG
jgi:hypothetical protein